MNESTHSKKRGMGLVGLLLVLGAALLSACGGGPPSGPAEKAPNFTVEDLDGAEVSLTQFLGRPVVLNFWASWCEPCKLEMPLLEAAYQKNKDSGLEILAVNYGESPEEVRAFAAEHGLSFRILLDRDLQVSTLIYRLRGLPVSVFVDREGNVAARHIGTLNETLLAGYLAQIVK